MINIPECFFKTKYLIPAVLIVLLVSCATSSDKRREKGQPASHDRIVIGQEYDDAGHHIVFTLSSVNAEAFNRTLHKKSLLDRTFRGISQDSHAVRKAMASLDSALDQAGIIMTRNLGENTRLTFVRSHTLNGEHRALLRIDRGDRGLSYMDFVLGKDEGGHVKIIDWHDYAQGQLYSDSLRQALVLMQPRDEIFIANVFRDSGVDKKTVGQFTELAGLSREKKYEQWIEKYKDLPAELKYSRIVLVTRVLITSAMGSHNEYRLALKDVSKYIGDDPSLSLLLVDHYVNERDYAAAHRALDRLNEYTGGDAAIDVIKANIHLTEKNYPESIRYAQTAIKEDPTFEDAYWTLLAVSVYAKQYEIAINTLSLLEHHFGYRFEPDEIARINGYEEFARSSIFTDWKYGLKSLTNR